MLRHATYNLRGGFLVRPLTIALALGCIGAFPSWLEESHPCASPKFCPPTESRGYGNIPPSDSGITLCYVEPASPLDRRTDSPLPQPRESRFGESRAPATTRGLETSASSATAGIGRQTLLGHRESSGQDGKKLSSLSRLKLWSVGTGPVFVCIGD